MPLRVGDKITEFAEVREVADFGRPDEFDPAPHRARIVRRFEPRSNDEDGIVTLGLHGRSLVGDRSRSVHFAKDAMKR